MTGSEINDLFIQALSGEYDDDAPWQAVKALQSIGTQEVFERAAELCKSNNPLDRARGADVLAQLGKTVDRPSTRFAEQSYSVITALMQHETEPQPLAAGIAALGHLDNPLAVPIIARFSSHPNPDVRFDVAFALGCFPNDPLSTAALLQLMQDMNKDVRDWATFGLGVLGDADSDEIRKALVNSLNDPDQDVSEEAMVGLGKRKDPRVLAALLPALERPEMTDRVIEAACLTLGMQNKRTGWTATDYAAALHERFSI